MRLDPDRPAAITEGVAGLDPVHDLAHCGAADLLSLVLGGWQRRREAGRPGDP